MTLYSTTKVTWNFQPVIWSYKYILSMIFPRSVAKKPEYLGLQQFDFIFYSCGFSIAVETRKFKLVRF